MKQRSTPVLVLLLLLWVSPVGACRGQAPATTSEHAPQGSLATPEAYGALIERLSGPEGYFDTDNLISNESSYLHAISVIRQLGLQGGAYIGVGPDQNFSYIAHLRPNVAFIIDIRRDNLLLHLLYKALFDLSDDRCTFLAQLFGREAPGDRRNEADAASLLDAIGTAPQLPAGGRASLQARVLGRIGTFGVDLRAEDLDTIRRLHDTFIEKGPALRFSSHGRPPQSYYPTYRQLALETDRSGRPASFLSDEALFQYVKQMHAQNRIVPVVGNFADSHVFSEMSRYLRSIDEEVVAFYTSNVEFYLMYQQDFGRFVENVRKLPAREDAVIIRSYFNRFRRSHPETAPGYASTQLVQYLHRFVDHPDVSYAELVSDYIR